jgi:hypothetical protein
VALSKWGEPFRLFGGIEIARAISIKHFFKIKLKNSHFPIDLCPWYPL